MSGTKTDRTLEVKRTFDIDPDTLFDAWMMREKWQAWIGPEGMFCEIPLLQPAVGGNFQIKMKIADDHVIPVAGIYREIEKPARIVFTWGRADDDISRHSLITVTLKNSDEKTVLTLWHDGLVTPESRDAHGRGWNETFDKLERYLAS